MYHSSEERAMHRVHTRVYMYTFDSIHPKYTLEAARVNCTLKAVVSLCAYTRIQIYLYNL